MRTAMEHWYEVEFKTGRPCMAVDQDKLYPIEDLVITENGKDYRVRDPGATKDHCKGCGRPAAPMDGYCGTCWFKYVYRNKTIDE